MKMRRELEVQLMHINTGSKTARGTVSLQTSGKHSAFITTNTMADASFKQEFLETHNTYRAKHGAQPLTYNSELNAAAQKWADHLLQIDSMIHSKMEDSEMKDGENIFNMSSSAPLKLTGKEAVETWYNEIKDYNWSRPGFSGSTGHFTQVVWKESTELGVGLATDGKKVFVVGQYRPAGNMTMPGYFEKNVLPQEYPANNTVHSVSYLKKDKWPGEIITGKGWLSVSSYMKMRRELEVQLMHINTGSKTARGTVSLQTSGKHSAFITTNTMADASFKQEFLETHNAYRAKHGAQPLTYNSELNAAAQKWADHLLQIGSMKHSKTEDSEMKDGENISQMSSSAPLKLTGKEAVESWYNEIKDYNWSRPGYSGSTGHFTQVVWKESTELGVGLATDGKKVFVVGQYRPAGNMRGCFEKNVLPQVVEEVLILQSLEDGIHPQQAEQCCYRLKQGWLSVSSYMKMRRELEVQLMHINTGSKTARGTVSLQTSGKHSAFITTNTMADASFKQEFLETHNTYRAKHGAQPLTYNSELNAAAQKWADHLLQIGSMKHRKTEDSKMKDGENISQMSSSAPLKLTGKEAVESWYNEIKDYNWSRPGYSDSTGHFTQVVWKESTELGVGLATDGKKVFVVGQYRPAGNMTMPGYFEKNVLPQA
ncbi:GLI pathogenesis-related 2 [Thunnus thynnus]|uniref:GLI pathogenesis-related 2 n=1 Tax=Thunnus thynnus TaxID=8237 RepID=UPI0035274392